MTSSATVISAMAGVGETSVSKSRPTPIAPIPAVIIARAPTRFASAE